MAIIKFSDRPFFRHSWSELGRMRQEMESHFFGPTQPQGVSDSTVFPPLTVFEEAGALVITAEVAGVEPADLNIGMEGDTLTIAGERRPLVDSGQAAYHRKEIREGSFSRALTLPAKINIDTISAKAVDGILTIVLPKASEEKARRIQVETG